MNKDTMYMNLRNALYGFLVAFMTMNVSPAYAQEDPVPRLQMVELPEDPVTTDGSGGELQTYLSTGERAPFDGVLLNPPAVAFIVSEYIASFEMMEAYVIEQYETDLARYNLEIGRLQLNLDLERRVSTTRIEGLEREITRLETMHQELLDERTSFWYGFIGDVIKIGCGVVIGISLGVLLGMVFAS